jgi:succinoglycan biosynthesis transport protein ExoP
MLKRIDDPIENISPRGPGPANSVALDLDPLLSAARRQGFVVAAFAIAGLVVGCAYAVLATPQYTATTDLLIDSQKKTDKNNQDVSASIAELTFDTEAIDSQVEVLKSEKIALAVVSNLNLTEDPEFVGSDNSWIARTLAELRALLDVPRWFVSEPKSDADPKVQAQRAAIGKLGNNMQVRRVGHTYVLAVDYTSPNPKKAAVVANAFGEAYLNDQLDAKYEAARRASTWMEARIAQLKAQSLSSDLAVQKFRAEHGLVSSDGKLVSEQQLTELNSQLVTAHSETARAEARFNQISDMLKSGEADGAVTDSLGSPIINDLRQKYLAASKTESS